MPRTIKFSRSWPYSLDGNTVLRAEPGDTVLLPDHLADAAMAFGGQLELAVAPTPTPELKDPPKAPAAPALADADPTTPPLADEAEDEDIVDETIHEPANDGKTVPPVLTRAQKRAAKKATK